MDYWNLTKQWFLDLCFPARCIGCGAFTPNQTYLCRTCYANIPLRSSFECIGCKQQVPLGIPCYLCKADTAVDHLFIVASLKESLLEKIIKTLKYRFIQNLAIPLTQLCATYIKKLSQQKHYSIFADNPLIIPVPLHPRRERWRGFNQAALIAKPIADNYQMAYSDITLIRVKATEAQATTEDREERFANISQSFAVAPDAPSLAGKTILLIDDICTSGATLNECATVLKQNGASKVLALVMARG